MDNNDLNIRFCYHAPDENKKSRHEHVRRKSLELAQHLLSCCPEGRELSLAITKLEEVMFWANSAIAREVVEE